MKTLGVRQIRASYDVLLETLAIEGEVVLTHHGKPFARVLPFEDATAVVRPKVRSMKWLRDQMPMQAVGSEVSIREERDAR
jgi:antitoxin (DNA-binding transcriptional repressor) of toxin-antitoxin stability system